MTTTATVTSTGSARRLGTDWLTAPLRGRTWARTAHLVLDLPVGLTAFSLAATAASTSAGLLATVVGVPLLVTTLVLARGYGRFERARTRLFLGAEIAAPQPASRVGLHPRSWLPALRDTTGWKAMLHALVAGPVSIVNFTVAVTGWITGFAFLTAPIAVIWQTGDPRIGALHLGSPTGIVLTMLAGVVIVLSMPQVVRALAAVDTALARTLLGTSER